MTNRNEDIAWAKKQVLWLWNMALPDSPLPKVKKILPPKEHIDPYDYVSM
jgi:hypothetical protein